MAAAATMPPEQIEIIVFAMGRSHLQLLNALPHVQFVGTAGQAHQLLTSLATKLQERETAVRKYHNEMGQTGSLAPTFPKRTLIVVDGLQDAMRQIKDFPTLIDNCAEQGQGTGINLIFADTGNGLNILKQQNYNFKSLQSACKFGCGVTFAVDQTSLGLLSIQMPANEIRQHEKDMGRGRAFLVYQAHPTVVQFATLSSPQEDELAYKQSIKDCIDHIISQHEASTETVQSIPEVN